MKRSTVAAASLAVLLSIAAFYALSPRIWSRLEHLHVYNGEAFLAFYCAGEAAAHGADPYRVEPLNTCEHRVDKFPVGVVEPAPFPPYVLPVFGAFAQLPYPVAVTCWIALLAFSLAIATWALARSTSLSWAVIAAALASLNWEQHIRLAERRPDINIVGRKLVVWLGLLMMFGCAFAAASQQRLGLSTLPTMGEPRLERDLRGT